MEIRFDVKLSGKNHGDGAREEAMQGLMSERPLLISSIIRHAAVYHRDTEIVSRTVEGPLHRYTYGEAERRSKRLARVLLKLGVQPGDRIGAHATMQFGKHPCQHAAPTMRRRPPSART